MFYFITNDDEIIVLNAGGDLERCCKLHRHFMAESWWDSGVKVQENFGFFTSEGQMDGFK